MSSGIALIFMASGRSKRFGGDKLTYAIDGVPMAERCFRAVPEGLFSPVAVVTRSAAVAELAKRRGFIPVLNPATTDDTAVTIRLGLELANGSDGCAFAVCDQPYLTADSYRKLAAAFSARPDRIVALSWRGTRGNPVLFPSALFDELRALPPGGTGRQVIQRHQSLLSTVEVADGRELQDIDTLDCIAET